jgi:predicted outer membrane protein
MKILMAVGTLIAMASAPCGAASETPARNHPQIASSSGDEANRYAAEAARFARKADEYATAAKEYIEAGKPITAEQAKRCAALSDMYRQLAVRVRDLASKARRISAQEGPRTQNI